MEGKIFHRIDLPASRRDSRRLAKMSCKSQDLPDAR
jgi:hypothetical protein